MHDRKKRITRILLAVLGTAAVALVAVFCFYMVWEKAPEVEPQAPVTKPVSGAKTGGGKKTVKEDAPEELPFDTKRKDGVYTVLFVGNDDGTGNTDTIVAGKIDTVQHRMDFVSIPRDTLINVDWSVRKINSVYWGSKNSGGSGIDALNMHIKNLTGFDIDCYAVIDLGVFIDVVDALGGVDFDVPVPMHYQDIGQNLYIDLEPGPQHLDGYQAMGVCRFRYGYADGDFGRMNMQHQFLKACADQFISVGSIPNISKVVKILSEGMDTNLSAGNIAYFLRQALLCDSGDINFYTAPSEGRSIGGLSYAVIDIDPWLDMVNEYLNPFDSPIGRGNVDIVFYNGCDYEATAELMGEWYYTWDPAAEEEAEESEDTGEPEKPGGPDEPGEGGDTEGPTIIVVPSPSPSPDAPEPEPEPEDGGGAEEPAPEEGVFA